MRILLTLLIIVLPLSLSAQIRVFDTHTPDSCSPNGQNSRQCPQGPLYQVQLVPLAVGLTLPRQIAFLPEGDFLVSELEDIRIVQDNELSSDPISGWPDRVLSSQSLMSVIVHPQFEQNAYIYVWYAKVRGEDDEESTMALARARLDLDELSLSDVEDIFVADAWSDLGGPFSGRAEFGPDGKIYLSINDHDPLWETDDPSIRMNSQAFALC